MAPGKKMVITMKSLKQFKREIQSLGYRVRTHVGDFSSMGLSPKRHLEVLDKQGNFVVGSGGNVYHAEHIAKHQRIFDLLIANRGQVYDTDYDPPLKVLF
jgi:hypothetical protein